MSAILKPSPNETARLMQDEVQRRRQTRILQVREQEKMFAMRIRRAIQEKQKQEIENLSNAFQKEWMQKHQTALRESEEKFSASLKEVGSAHDHAKENEPNQALEDAKREQMLKTAKERGKAATQHERDIRAKEEEESVVARKRRHIALIKEKLRARHIANLPAPAPNPADAFLQSMTTTGSSETWSSGSLSNRPQRYTTIMVADHNSTMPTTVSLGLPSDAVVERATEAEAAADAREDAIEEGERIRLLQAERDRAVHECMEKAKVRHQAALEQARLDRERKDLMDDLKQMKAKDALRRQYHIEYKWENNAKMTQACNEMFGRPGSKFRESELFSTDLKKDEHESVATEEDQSYGDTSEDEDERPGWTLPEKEDQAPPPPRRHALGKLLKQIEQQRENLKKREQHLEKDAPGMQPSIRQTLNSISSIAPDKTAESSSTSPDDSVEEEPASNQDDAIQQHLEEPKATSIPLPTFTVPITQSTTTEPKPISSKMEGHEPGRQYTTAKKTTRSPPKMQRNPLAAFDLNKLAKETSITGNSSAGTSLTTSESLLVKSLESVRNDETLLRSVKDFQERILQQHKSCAKIQEQIQRLEAKKANLDCLITDITKPKSF